MKYLVLAPLFALVAACGGQPADKAPDAPAPSDAAKVAGSWTVDYAKSRLGFSATQSGKAFDGEFGKYNAVIVFDPENLASASIDVTVDMTSAKTGDKQRDTALPRGDWFKAKDFPTAHFASTNVEKTGDGAYVVHGNLTIRDASKDLELPFTLSTNGDTAKAQGETTLLRTDFGVGQGEFSTDEWVGLDVNVTVDITATQ